MDPLTTTDPASPQAAPAKHLPDGALASDQAIFYIAAFKLVKALLFFAAAMGLFRMVNKDNKVEIAKILHAVRIDGDSRFAKMVLVEAKITDPQKKIFGYVLSLYGALFATEGIGLLLRKRWAEYFTVIMTASGIPIELYELLHRAGAKVQQVVPQDQHASFFLSNRTTGLKLALLFVNAAILWYLINYLRRHKPHPEAALKTVS